jgi:hypothetical protein
MTRIWSGTVTPDTWASVPAVACAQHLQTPANGSGTSLDPDKESIMAKLGIGPHLPVHHECGLHISYEKWKAYLKASNTYSQMCTDGTWTGPTLTAKDIIELFVSKSHLHSHFKKSFPKVIDYPDMAEWPNGEGNTDDPNYNKLVWWFDKVNYTFVDLFEWMNNGGANKGKKVKGKGKGKGKEKNKDRKKDREEGNSKARKDKDSKGRGSKSNELIDSFSIFW